MDKLKISSLLLGTFLMPVVSYGSADFGEADGQFAGVVVSDEALFSAIRAGNFDLVNYLIDHGANVNARGKEPKKYYEHTFDHFSPLSLAIQSGNFEMVNLLIDRGAGVNDFIEEMECHWGYSFTHYLSPLVVAIRTGSIDMVRLLLARGANVNTQGGKYNVPLYEAVKKGPEMALLILKQNGININVPQDIGMSYDEYENNSLGYDKDSDYQVSETAPERIRAAETLTSKGKEVVRLMSEKGARTR
jgi:hypothetical protein